MKVNSIWMIDFCCIFCKASAEGVGILGELWQWPKVSIGNDQRQALSERLSSRHISIGRCLAGQPLETRSQAVWPLLHQISTSDGQPSTIGFHVDRASSQHISTSRPSSHQISTLADWPSVTRSRVTLGNFGSQVDGHLGDHNNIVDET